MSAVGGQGQDRAGRGGWGQRCRQKAGPAAQTADSPGSKCELKAKLGLKKDDDMARASSARAPRAGGAALRTPAAPARAAPSPGGRCRCGARPARRARRAPTAAAAGRAGCGARGVPVGCACGRRRRTRRCLRPAGRGAAGLRGWCSPKTPAGARAGGRGFPPRLGGHGDARRGTCRLGATEGGRARRRGGQGTRHARAGRCGTRAHGSARGAAGDAPGPTRTGSSRHGACTRSFGGGLGSGPASSGRRPRWRAGGRFCTPPAPVPRCDSRGEGAASPAGCDRRRAFGAGAAAQGTEGPSPPAAARPAAPSCTAVVVAESAAGRAGARAAGGWGPGPLPPPWEPGYSVADT